MKHERFTYLDRCYILTGDCITVYDDNGKKLEHNFFVDCETALLAYSCIKTSLMA